MYFGAGAHWIPWGGPMGSHGGVHGIPGWALGDPWALGTLGPLGTHWPLGTPGPWGPLGLGDPWALGTLGPLAGAPIEQGNRRPRESNKSGLEGAALDLSPGHHCRAISQNRQQTQDKHNTIVETAPQRGWGLASKLQIGKEQQVKQSG